LTRRKSNTTRNNDVINGDYKEKKEFDNKNDNVYNNDYNDNYNVYNDE
jgi:hypothetical protein